MNVQEHIREFVHTLNRTEYLEALVKESKAELETKYAILVNLCPHAEVADHHMSHGMGTWRVCKTCGLEDHALVGASSGDEYNYGYPGRIDEKFWAGSEAELVDENTFNSYRKQHRWQVVNGGVKQ